ncbi:hypothetical protein [Paraburkholderia pallida]|uniref:Uncharacterized protein n=1 Tax=Paraburkholderia pallida TaxID=2547399 RepID=A0A4P7CS37_9BURK|nr:hypothetical protein [Paraburkholderia pallida]QBQ97897.1 hypothetical protein E1956_12400 [Paraburkholderia pallida]
MHNDAKHFAEKAPQLETEKREADFSAYVDEAIRQALRDQPADLPNNSTVIYHRSFPIGSALADIFTHRTARDDIGLGPSIAHLIEKLAGLSVPDETPEQQARRALLCGFCWEIAGLLKLGANGGFQFNVHDEGLMLMNGVRKGRASDARIVRGEARHD